MPSIGKKLKSLLGPEGPVMVINSYKVAAPFYGLIILSYPFVFLRALDAIKEGQAQPLLAIVQVITGVSLIGALHFVLAKILAHKQSVKAEAMPALLKIAASPTISYPCSEMEMAKLFQWVLNKNCMAELDLKSKSEDGLGRDTFTLTKFHAEMTFIPASEQQLPYSILANAEILPELMGKISSVKSYSDLAPARRAQMIATNCRFYLLGTEAEGWPTSEQPGTPTAAKSRKAWTSSLKKLFGEMVRDN